MKRQLVAILGYFGFANTGDEAILHCMLGELRKLQQERPHLDLAVFSGDVKTTARIHAATAIPSVLPTTWFDFFYRFVRGDRAGYRKALKTFRNMDTLIVGGGGLFFDHADSNVWFRKTLLKIDWAKRLGKQVVVFGVGVGPLHLAESRELLRKTLSSVDLITVRDEESARLLNEIGVDGPPVHTTGDFVFLLEPAPKDRIDQILAAEKLHLSERPRIGICLQGDYVKRPVMKESMVRFCEYALGTLGADLWFIPMQTGGGFDDRPGAREIASELSGRDRISLIEGQYTPWETMGLMAHCHAILGVRLHGVILAMNNHTPVFGISYMPKVERVYKELGRPDWQIGIDDLTPETLIEGFGRLWNDRQQVAAELARAHRDLRQRALANFALLAEKLDVRHRR
ncbi:MAG: polysaccharide pyruvyl transferase family protein [Candidatus Zixiibacteriota bacterium]